MTSYYSNTGSNTEATKHFLGMYSTTPFNALSDNTVRALDNTARLPDNTCANTR
jgi:hypothetical protein